MAIFPEVAEVSVDVVDVVDVDAVASDSLVDLASYTFIFLSILHKIKQVLCFYILYIHDQEKKI